MSWKNRGTTARRMNSTINSTISKNHCLVFFPKEDSYGIWPDHLLRSKGRFCFEAKYKKDWFECRIEKEGTLEECESAQKALEKSMLNHEKQWSSIDTELSDDEDGDNIQTISTNAISTNELHRSINKTVAGNSWSASSSDEEESILKEISASILNKKKRTSSIRPEIQSKKKRLNEETITEMFENNSATVQTVSATNTDQVDLDKKVASVVDSKLADLKKIMAKMYSLQKRTSVDGKKNNPPPISEVLIVNNINLMTLPGKTASRFLLSAARIVLTDEEFTNGYLPDFRGDKTGRVPISQASVDKLREAVRMRFGYKNEDMNSIWATIRSSLVQKVSDIRKHNRKSQQLSEQQLSQQTTTLPNLQTNTPSDNYIYVSQEIVLNE